LFVKLRAGHSILCQFEPFSKKRFPGGVNFRDQLQWLIHNNQKVGQPVPAALCFVPNVYENKTHASV